MRAAAFIVVMAAQPAMADATRQIGVTAPGTYVTLRPSEDINAVADVVFQNEAVNFEKDNQTFTLRDNGVEVSVTYTYGLGMTPDRIDVEPPEGLVCAPACSIDVREGGEDVIRLYRREGVGA